MKDTKVLRAQRSAALLQRQFLHGDGSLFDQVLDAPMLTTVLARHGTSCRERLYPPLHTLRLFIGQVLSADRACQDVVGRRLSERLAQGQSANALNTGSYCDTRQRLPLALPVALGVTLGAQLESLAPKHWHWQGRCVKLDVATSRNVDVATSRNVDVATSRNVFDGTTVSMPDTPSNQQAYPQSREQKPGLGFPDCAYRRAAWPGQRRGCAIKSRPVKARGRASKACCGTCCLISMRVMSCSPMRCWLPGGLLKQRAVAASMW